MADITQDEAIARAGLVAVDSYDVFLDLTTDPVRSRTQIRFRWLRPGATTFADLRTRSVRSVTLDGVSLPPPRAGRVHLPGDGGEGVLVVEAEAGFSQDGRGLSRFTDPADGAVYVAANCYPDCGPEVFCCFDQPDLTATFRFSVRVPAGWECVANGELSRSEDGVYEFAPVSGMRPYDVAFCAGPFSTAARTRASRTEVTIRHRRSLENDQAVAALPRFAEYARKAIAWYEETLGVPCPYPAYDIVLVPDLAALAVSIPGLMMVNESLLARPAEAADRFNAMICAHEVAHLWFGCLVGAKWWDDVWLDEALATYLSYAALSALTGTDEAESWTEYAYSQKPQAYRADELPSRAPVSSPVTTSADGRAKPFGIVYVKGASVIRQLAALIGDDVLCRGLHDYLTEFGTGGSAALADLVGCWSRASGRDLAGWADQWLRTEGATTLRLDGNDMVSQDVPRWQRIGIGLYDLAGDGRLHRRRLLHVELSAARTAVPELSGEQPPDAIVLNDQDLGYARIGFDAASRRVLTAADGRLDDPLAEAVCWTAFWQLVTGAEVPAQEFVQMVAGRLEAGKLSRTGVETLLQWAVAAADGWAHPALRASLRERIADAARHAPADTRACAAGFVASAQTDAQLAVLDGWLAGTDLPDGLTVDADLRARILFTLAARGRASREEIDALPAIDPVTGDVNRATCLAMRPEEEAKQAAWTAALSPELPARIAAAHAAGIWVPGQEELMAGYRERYFAAALPALAGRTLGPRQRLGRLLFPSTLVSEQTIEMAEAASPDDKALRLAVADQAAIMRQQLAARLVL